eukprot:TRINITY_DN1756_c0_g3_i1.p1 TRINITY_DN1756_c0_g3~~TRINITY_DN1756_c0_g3_i1.p1  ORF type:complete len:247 (-),score=73.56 TRINITY_DN1756_c0_g3_i1:73-813(-)
MGIIFLEKMTTAHRPTWKASVGGSEQGGNRMVVPSRQYSSRDLPGQLTLKERRTGQGRLEETSAIDFKAELQARERELKETKNRLEGRPSLEPEPRPALDEPPLTKKPKLDEDEEEQNPFPQDKDDSDFVNQSEEKESSDDEESDDDSDNELLRMEFERIKKEREEEEKRKSRERQAELGKLREMEVMRNNPLLDPSSDYSLQKKWFEDTVFKNQARSEPKDRRRFINDTVRSDFHKKFLNKYILN